MKKLVLLMISLVLLFSVTSVYAVPSGVYSDYLGLFLDDGAGNTALVTSNTGQATFNGSLGNWAVNVTTAITYPFLGSQSTPAIDLNSVNVTSTGGGTLKIWASASGFTPATGATPFLFDVGGTTDGTVQFKAYWDNFTGFLFWTGYPPLGDTGVITDSPFAESFSGITPAGAVDYTLYAEIIHTGGGQGTSFNADFAVPEPATMLLFGSGLLGLGIFARKRFIKK